MRRIVFLGFAVLAATVCVMAQAQGQGKGDLPAPGGEELVSFEQKVSYCIGLDVGANLKAQNIAVDSTAFLTGLATSLEGKKPLLKDEEIAAIMQEFGALKRKEFEEQRQKLAKAALAEGEAFLTKNKQAKGVVTTKSGLQYQVVKEGKGASPKASDEVTVHYRGVFVDGREFDSSYGKDGKGEPVSFPVNGVIPGWTEALQLMSPGAKYKLFIPASLAYGEEGNEAIPPNSVLVFDVEMLKVNGK